MARKKKNKDIFYFGVIIALEPVDWCIKKLKYPIGVILAIFIAVFWTVWVLFISSTIQTLVKMSKILKDLIKNNICIH
jgi:hypothetical protein